MKPEQLLRLYPRAWRERYGEELAALLQQTGVGWRQIVDVIAAASREWLRAVIPNRALLVAANQTRRVAGFYAMAWVTILWIQWLLPARAPRLAIGDPNVHARVVVLFAVGALVTRGVEESALRAVFDGRVSKTQAHAVSVLSLMITIVLVYLYVEIFGFTEWRPLLRAPALFAIVMCSGFFGRPSIVQSAWSRRPQRPPAPPSIRGLGLSA